MSEVSLTIDGRSVAVPHGTSVLEAARQADVYVPSLCYDPELEPYGGCRLCVVEIEGIEGLPTSCTTQAADGMVVRTDTEAVNDARRTVCEMMIADHPEECLVCASNQQCELQEIAAYLGIRERSLDRTEREAELDESNPFFVRDLSRCVLCGRCVRVCRQLQGVGAIGLAGRGYESRVATFRDVPIDETVCESCGECVERCPVGAISPKAEFLPPTSEVKTTCPYCGCGCGLELGVRNGRIVKVSGDFDHPVSRGSLCVKGRFGLDFVNSPDRLTTPLIRRDGELQEATWDEALDLVADRFGRIRRESGPDALAGLSSAKCSNEENYLFQKLMRAAVGTNNVDHCARLCHSSTVAGLARAFGSGAMTNSIGEFEDADCILVTGSNTTEAHPIIGLRVKAAVRNGAKLIVADPRRIDLVRFAELHLQQRCGTDVALFNAMMNVILEERLQDEEYIRERTEECEAVRDCVADYTPERAEAITGVPADDIRRAARTYAAADRSSIIYSMGITQHTTGTDNVLALADLAMMTGNVGRRSTGVNPLRGQNNVQGACDLGALPNVYSGYQKVEEDEVRRKFEDAWGVDLPAEAGLTVVEIINSAAEGRVRGLYVMGENPMLSDPDVNHVEEALRGIDFLCVQDIFLSETAELADVVLPAASFAEKAGTFTNTERRVQPIRPAVPAPGDARPDWEVICDLSGRLGFPMSYESPAEVMDEIAALTPIYGGMSYERIEAEDGLHWPCRDADDPGTVFLHEGTFARGKGRFYATPFREADELPDQDYPYMFTTGRLLYHWHTGTLSRQSPGLEEVAPPTPVEISPRDAEREGIEDGDILRVSSRRGTVEARAVVTEKSPPGTLFMPFHFREAPANRLTNPALDPVAKIPEFKVCAVRIEPAREPAEA
ncbi:MAG: formate dehydrogenase subunit alpha [Planctomycetota bacterium]